MNLREEVESRVSHTENKTQVYIKVRERPPNNNISLLFLCLLDFHVFLSSTQLIIHHPFQLQSTNTCVYLRLFPLSVEIYYFIFLSTRHKRLISFVCSGLETTSLADPWVTATPENTRGRRCPKNTHTMVIKGAA